MQGVILAGGRGQRLRPLTRETAKALIPVHGRPLLDNAIDLFWKYKVYELWLSLGYLEHQIRAKYPLPFWVDRHTETRQIINLGTGGWLNRLAIDPAQPMQSDFYVCNADNLFNLDLDEMMSYHKRSNNVVTIAVTKVKDIREYGAVHLRNNNKVLSFEEKKNSRIKKSGWVNGGYYIFSPRVMEYVKKLNIDVNSPLSLEKDLFPLLAKEGVLGAYKPKEGTQWFDTGTFERWEKVLNEWDGVLE